MKILLLVGFMFAAFASIGFSDPKTFYIERWVRSEHSLASIGDFQVGEFDQRINPQDPKDARTFKQRYFLNSTFVKGANGPHAPVFYYICGEATCSEYELSRISHYAKEFSAHLVALEHRYYGKSQPFNELTGENLKYLTTGNALSDLANFQKHAVQKFNLKGKWIAVGGSYSGSLSAYYRQKFPNLVVGALASSAPVKAKESFHEYDRHVAKVVSPACASALRQVTQAVQASLADPIKLQLMKHLFESDAIKDPVDFLMVVADMPAYAVQYGSQDLFCQEVLGNGQPSDFLKNYAAAGIKIFQKFGITPVQDSLQGAESLDPADYFDTFGMRQWMYQSCTEYGYFQVADPDRSLSVRSSLIDVNFYYRMCDHLFGSLDRAATERINQNYYLPLLDARTSNIFFTNGSTDPWSNLSISKELGNDTNPNTRAMTIEGAAHCDDLGSGGSTAVLAAKNEFRALVKEWLK